MLNNDVAVMLKPCPFCGSNRLELHNTENGTYWIICGECNCGSPICDSMAQATDAWNKRDDEANCFLKPELRLKPCPLCGSKAEFSEITRKIPNYLSSIYPQRKFQWYKIRCSKCRLSLEDECMVQITYKPPFGTKVNDKELAKAVHKWNERQ